MGKLTVRFNGFYSETTHDIFTGRVDFEGYRIYTGLDDRPSSYSLVRSYDRENFTRYTWGLENNVETWIQDEFPHSRAALRQMYDDPDFDPENYTRTDPYRAQPPIAYFEPQDFNQFSLVEPDGIRKVYPDAPNPGTDSTKWLEDELVFDYGEPLPKYYEYEYVLENLLPTIPYNVAVTAFDYGSPKSGLASLESKPENNSIEEFPQPSSETVVEDQLDVYIIPNPYRLDGAYLQRGFENRVREGKDEERTRRIHFFNLPAVCTISIYSIDGDMIRQLEHNFPEGGPSSMHHTWDMITRNSQSVVSGLYYWVVEGDGRNQIGRLAVIK